MPVLTALLSGEPLRTINILTHEPEEPDRVLNRQTLGNKFVHFDVQTGSDLYWLGNQDYFLVRDDFVGVMRLPFPLTWMEWKVPQVVRMQGKLVQRPYPEHDPACAAALTEWSIEQACQQFDVLRSHIVPECDHVMIVEMFLRVEAPDPFVITWPICKAIQVNTEGTAVGSHHLWSGDQDDPKWIAAGEEWSEGMGDMNAAFHALALINCRNVTTVDAGRVVPRRSGAQKRRREFADIRYKTIVLPGTKGSSGGSQTGSHTEDMALHKVRGHFKTFTADKPLLGKHVGTYWWGWQVRGNAEHGVNINDYRLDEETG